MSDGQNQETPNTGPSSASGAEGMAAEILQEIDPQRIIERAKLVLTDPKGCWQTISAEPLTVKLLIYRYVIGVGALTAICSFIGFSVLGPRPIGTGLIVLIGTVLLYPFVVLFYAWLMKQLTPYFQGTGTFEDCAKLAVFSGYPAAAGSVLHLVPLKICVLLASLIGLYGLYVFWLGMSPMLKLPDEKRVPFFVTFIASVIVCAVIFGMVFGGLMAI